MTVEDLTAPIRPVHLDLVDPRANLLSDHPDHLRHAVRQVALEFDLAGLGRRVGGIEPVARDEHAGARHGAAVDQIAHGDVGVLEGSQVADRGDAALESLACVLLGEKHRDGRRAVRGLIPRTRACLGIVVISKMRVGVDQSRESRVAPQVDDLHAASDQRILGADRHDAVALHDHDRILHRLSGAVHEPAETDRQAGRLWRGRSRPCGCGGRGHEIHGDESQGGGDGGSFLLRHADTPGLAGWDRHEDDRGTAGSPTRRSSDWKRGSSRNSSRRGSARM